MAREKRKRDEKLEQGYKRFVKILNQDVEELHKMKTSGECRGLLASAVSTCFVCRRYRWRNGYFD